MIIVRGNELQKNFIFISVVLSGHSVLCHEPMGQTLSDEYLTHMYKASNSVVTDPRAEQSALLRLANYRFTVIVFEICGLMFAATAALWYNWEGGLVGRLTDNLSEGLMANPYSDNKLEANKNSSTYCIVEFLLKYENCYAYFYMYLYVNFIGIAVILSQIYWFSTTLGIEMFDFSTLYGQSFNWMKPQEDRMMDHDDKAILEFPRSMVFRLALFTPGANVINICTCVFQLFCPYFLPFYGFYCVIGIFYENMVKYL